jgi:hypothetical protein
VDTSDGKSLKEDRDWSISHGTKNIIKDTIQNGC